MKKNSKPPVGNTTTEVSFLGLPHNLGEFRQAVSHLSAAPGKPDPAWAAAGAPLRAHLIAWCEVTEATAAAKLRAPGDGTIRRDAECSLALASANRKLVPLIEGLSLRVASRAKSIAAEKRERETCGKIAKHEFLELRARDIRNPDGSLPPHDQLDKAARIERALGELSGVPLDFRADSAREKLTPLQADGTLDGELTIEAAAKRIKELEAEHLRIQEIIESGLSADEIIRLRSLAGEIAELERQAAEASRRADACQAQVMDKEQEIKAFAEAALIIVDAVITAHEITLNSIPAAA
jgi:arsenate reductase-like glutaredoxin family protein